MPNSTTRTQRVLAVLAVTGALAAAGCSATTSGNASAPAASAVQAVTVTTIDGATLAVPSGRPAVLFFFTVGCGECVTGGTALAQARAQAGSKADFVLVDLDPSEPRQAIDAFRQATGDAAMPVVTTASLDLAQKWKVNRLSTAIVISKDGAETFRGIDPAAQDLLAAIDKAAR